jgi:uncharacterized protein YkwD
MSARRARSLSLVLLVVAGTAASLPPAAVAQVCAASGSQATLCLLNSERTTAGLHPVRLDRGLSHAAEAYSHDMVTRRFFSHVSPSGEQLAERVARTGWLRRRPRWVLGETLGWGTGSLSTPAAIVAAWMHSPPHRHIVLGRRFRRVGIGIAAGTPFGPRGEGATFTADFGSGRRVLRQ